MSRSSLTLPDRITVEPIGAPTTAPTSRRRLGRTSGSTVELRGIVELGGRSKRDENGLVRQVGNGTLYLDPVECARKGWAPAKGDRLVSVVWNKTGRTETLGLYLDSAVTIGAGGVLSALLADRSPGREST